MSQNDARDPFVGLNEHIRRQANGQFKPCYAIGKVQSVQPLVIRADGMDLDADDLRIPEHLAPASWPVVSKLPTKVFYGRYNSLTGEVTVTRPEELVSGLPNSAVDDSGFAHRQLLKVGDEVLLMRSSDGQTYYLLERMVAVSNEPVSTD